MYNKKYLLNKNIAKLFKNMPLMALTTNTVMNGMETNNIDKKKIEEKELEKSNSLLDNIKADYFLQKL